VAAGLALDGGGGVVALDAARARVANCSQGPDDHFLVIAAVGCFVFTVKQMPCG